MKLLLPRQAAVQTLALVLTTTLTRALSPARAADPPPTFTLKGLADILISTQEQNQLRPADQLGVIGKGANNQKSGRLQFCQTNACISSFSNPEEPTYVPPWTYAPQQMQASSSFDARKRQLLAESSSEVAPTPKKSIDEARNELTKVLSAAPDCTIIANEDRYVYAEFKDPMSGVVSGHRYIYPFEMVGCISHPNLVYCRWTTSNFCFLWTLRSLGIARLLVLAGMTLAVVIVFDRCESLWVSLVGSRLVESLSDRVHVLEVVSPVPPPPPPFPSTSGQRLVGCVEPKSQGFKSAWGAKPGFSAPPSPRAPSRRPLGCNDQTSTSQTSSGSPPSSDKYNEKTTHPNPHNHKPNKQPTNNTKKGLSQKTCNASIKT